MKQLKFEDTLKLFEEAKTLNSKSALVQFGLGQFLLKQNETEKACEALESVLVNERNCYETRKILAFVYSLSPSTASKAGQHFDAIRATLKSQGIADDDINDPNLLIALAQYFETGENARKYYNILLSLYKDTETKLISPELLNNIAALYQIESGDNSMAPRQQSLQSAETIYQEALILLTNTEYLAERDEHEILALKSTIRYNIARLYESKGETEKAKQQYIDLLSNNPANLDCILRLGVIELEQKKFEEALDKFSDVLAIDPLFIDAWILVGYTNLKMRNFKAARRAFERILRTMDKHEAYSLCSTGNLCLRFALEDPKSRIIHLKRAVEFFCIALRDDPKNVKAAAGIAIAYVHSGLLEDAIGIFQQIQAVSSWDRDLTMCIGNVLMATERYQAAISTFELIDKREEASSEVFTALAKCQYVMAKNKTFPPMMKKAQEYAQKAVDIHQNDTFLLYNLALIKQQHAHLLNSQPPEMRHLRSMEALKAGLADLEETERVFSELSSRKDAPKKTIERSAYSAALKRITERKIHETSIFQTQRDERLEEIKRKKESDLESLERQKEIEVEQRRIRDAEIDIKRKELQQKVQAENMKMKESFDREKEKDTKRSAAKDSSSDEEDASRPR